ncbi:uncharacterized protein V1516DRAFT_661810 [Lipomyces oligophaga]|uniref:uncharacterized protein n=1 Tax=Lipomyces oligophaga TaxID=45792 RepID=UPI0034CFBA96
MAEEYTGKYWKGERGYTRAIYGRKRGTLVASTAVAVADAIVVVVAAAVTVTATDAIAIAIAIAFVLSVFAVATSSVSDAGIHRHSSGRVASPDLLWAIVALLRRSPAPILAVRCVHLRPVF